MNPQVIMSWDMWCSSHLEFLRAQWPLGSIHAMLELFNLAAQNSEIANWCQGDAEKLSAAMKHFSPVCCFLGDEAMQGLIEKVKEQAQI